MSTSSGSMALNLFISSFIGPSWVKCSSLPSFHTFTVRRLVRDRFSTVSTFNILPSLIIILIVAKALDKFQSSKLVDNGFKGLRPSVCGLIAAAALTVFSEACLKLELYEKTKRIMDAVSVEALILFAVLFFVNKKFKLHPICIIIPSAIIGIIMKGF